jgi:hypothetical protein
MASSPAQVLISDGRLVWVRPPRSAPASTTRAIERVVDEVGYAEVRVRGRHA